MKLSDADIAAMVVAIVSEADYDIGKSYDEDMVEEPEYVDERIADLVATAKCYIPSELLESP